MSACSFSASALLSSRQGMPMPFTAPARCSATVTPSRSSSRVSRGPAAMTPTEPINAVGLATMRRAAIAARYAPEAPVPRIAATSGFLAASRARARYRSSEPAAEPPGESTSRTTAGTRLDSRRRRASSIHSDVRPAPRMGPYRRSTATRPGGMWRDEPGRNDRSRSAIVTEGRWDLIASAYPRPRFRPILLPPGQGPDRHAIRVGYAGQGTPAAEYDGNPGSRLLPPPPGHPKANPPDPRGAMVRIIVYTGKGGVGKTSVAAASAILCAGRGYRTIVLSTDIAHSLADAFDVPLGPEPTPIAENLDGQEPDVCYNIARYWRTIQNYVTELFAWRGLDEVMAEELTVLPGMDELGNLLWITDHVNSGKYDVVVVDAAPTGETLRLLSLPDASRWWIERIAPIGRRVSRLGRPMLERVLGIPIPQDAVFAAAERLLDRLGDVHRLLSDPDQTSVRITLALDKLSVSEARRSFTYFYLFCYPSDMIIANRVLPADTGPYFSQLREAQQRYLPIVHQEFGPVPVRTIPQFDHEMVGIAQMREIGTALFGDD